MMIRISHGGPKILEICVWERSERDDREEAIKRYKKQASQGAAPMGRKQDGTVVDILRTYI
jgi:hypothetical protein